MRGPLAARASLADSCGSVSDERPGMREVLTLLRSEYSRGSAEQHELMRAASAAPAELSFGACYGVEGVVGGKFKPVAYAEFYTGLWCEAHGDTPRCAATAAASCARLRHAVLQHGEAGVLRCIVPHRCAGLERMLPCAARSAT